MYTISVNGKQSLKTDLSVLKNSFSGMLDGKEVQGDFLKINDYQYHILYKGKS